MLMTTRKLAKVEWIYDKTERRFRVEFFSSHVSFQLFLAKPQANEDLENDESNRMLAWALHAVRIQGDIIAAHAW